MRTSHHLPSIMCRWAKHFICASYSANRTKPNPFDCPVFRSFLTCGSHYTMRKKFPLLSSPDGGGTGALCCIKLIQYYCGPAWKKSIDLYKYKEVLKIGTPDKQMLHKDDNHILIFQSGSELVSWNQNVLSQKQFELPVHVDHLSWWNFTILPGQLL